MADLIDCWIPAAVSAKPASPLRLTELLAAWQGGQNGAFGQAFALVYEELKRIASQRLRQSGSDLTLSPTALLHEAYLRVAESDVVFKNRAHFFAGMSLYIRSALVDHARARTAAKRGGLDMLVSLSEAQMGEEAMVTELLALDQSLQALAALDPRCAEVMHLLCFAGLDREEIADVLTVSLATVDRDLRFGKAWIREELAGGR
ncbi:RNA polymerase subunit sigma-70 [Ahniella affigens]|uniref:RNA polymerase subunit sigma-70 n=1 Tax=Ahniella affigens TaxID=2021234 RepID=A0A2P1PU13_9GAMM|nr:RNA polymerase subunit sigma-70 [Ahniella affigens]